MKKLFIFDCDGTLVDSETLYNTITSDLLTEIGLPQYTPQECLRQFAGYSWGTIRDHLTKEHGPIIPDDIIQRYIRTANQAMNSNLKTSAGAKELITIIEQHNKTCIASNGERGNVLKSLEITGLLEHFCEEKQIFTKIQVPNPKPHPDLFLYAADQMQTHPDHCIVIEDSASGVRAAKAANMKVIAYIGNAHDQNTAATELKKLGADAISTRLIHIPELANTL